MSSSPWAQWGALLLPRPDPRDFARPRASSSSSVLVHPDTPSTLRPSLSTKSLSATFARRRAKKTPPVSGVPPRLEPLQFSTDPIVDLTLPPYQPPPAARSPRSLSDPSASPPARAAQVVGNPKSADYTHRPHPPAVAGHSGRQRHNEFNYDGSYVTHDANPSLMPPSIRPAPHDARTDTSAPRTPQPSPLSCLPPLHSLYNYNPPTSSSHPHTTLDAPLRRLHSHPAPATNYTSSTPSTHVDETHQNSNLINATDMLKFRRKSSNVPSSATSYTITSPSIIRKLTKKCSTPTSSIPVLTVTPPPDPRALALLDASPPAFVAAPIIEPIDLQMASTPRVPSPSTSPPRSPFPNIKANIIGDTNTPDYTTEATVVPEDSEPRGPTSNILASSDSQHTQTRVQNVQDSTAKALCVSGPPEQGRGASLRTQLQRDVDAIGPKADRYLSLANNRVDGVRSECGHGAMRKETLGGLERDEQDEVKLQAKLDAESAPAASRLGRGDGGPRGLDARFATADAAGRRGNSASTDAGTACVTSASYRSAMLQTQALAMAGEPDRPGRRYSSKTGGESEALSVHLATRPSSADAISHSTTMSNKRSSANVLQKKRADASSSSSSAASFATAYSSAMPLSSLSQSSTLSASSATTTEAEQHLPNTEVGPWVASSSTMVTAKASSPTTQYQAQQSLDTMPVLAKATSPSTSSAVSSSSSSEHSASRRSGKDTLGFLRWRRWSVGRGVSLARGEDGRNKRRSELLTEGIESEVDETRMSRWGRVGEGDKPGDVAPTASHARRPRTVSHGKLVKPRAAETTTPEIKVGQRRPKFILGNDSEPELPGGASTTHAITRLSLTQESPPRRPPLLPHNTYLDPEQPSAPGRRRWTLASAMLDEAISDASLIRELERMRAIGAWEKAQRQRKEQEQDVHAVEGIEKQTGEKAETGIARDDGSSIQSEEVWDIDVGLEIWAGREGMLERDEGLATNTNSAILDGSPLASSPASTYTPTTSSFPLVSAPSASSWLAAQRALLTCRELLLTERRYLVLMQTLLNAHTVPAPPPLMLHYVSDLVRASETVLADMEKRPSVAGVADAFVQRQAELETAYVRWCGVVGGFFVPHSESAGADEADLGGGSVEGHPAVKRRRTAGDVEPTTQPLFQHSGPPPVTPLLRTVSTWRKSMPSIPSLGLGTVGENGVSVAQHGPGHGNAVRKREEDTPSPSPTTPAVKPIRKHSVRDLAILPTQRVMRYVLLYRDLLSHTPSSSSSRPVVERAIEAACRIADKCNRAQGNAAFIVGNPNAPVHDTSFSGARSGSGASNSSRGSARSRVVSSRPSSPSTKTLESSSSTSHASTSISASTAVTSATSLSAHSAFVDNASTVQVPPGRTVASVRRTSMSAVSLSLMTSMGWSRGRSNVPHPMSASCLPEGRFNTTHRPADTPLR